MVDELKDISTVIKSLFETRYLKRIPRAGTTLLLGSDVKENVAEHSFYTTLIAIIMHHFDKTLDLGKLLIMCLTHDLEEVRTGDQNQVNRLYQNHDSELKAFADMWQGSDLGKELVILHEERIKLESKEAIYAKDCDTLAELLIEKEYSEKGNLEAQEWMDFTIARLKTDLAKTISKEILNQRMSAWWEEIKNNIREKNGLSKVDYNKKLE